MRHNQQPFWLSITVFSGIIMLCSLWLALRPGALPPAMALSASTTQAASLRIDIDPATQTLDTGESAQFIITVQNTGTDPLTDLRLESNLLACQQPLAATLAPGAVTGYTCTTDPLRRDLVLSLVVFATTPAETVIRASSSASVNVIAPQIDVTLSPATRQVLAGSPATFTVAITNSGEFTLAFVIADDPALLDCARTDERTLPVGAHFAYTCGVESTTEDFTHTITVEGSPPVGRIVTDTATARVQIIEPALKLDLLPASQTVPRNGQTELTVRITNQGDAQLELFAVDAPLAPRCVLTQTQLLAPGELAGYACPVDVTDTDFTVKAAAHARTPVGTQLTARSSAAIDVLAPDLTLLAEPLSQTVTTGTDATVLYTVTNTGNFTLEPVTLTVLSTPPYNATCDQTLLPTLASGSAASFRCTVPGVTSTLTQTATAQGTATGDAAGEIVRDALRVDINAFPFATVQGMVWEDLNGDGLRSGDEPGLAAVTVRVIAATAGGDTPVDSAISDGNGTYALRRIPPGPIRIAFLPPDGYHFSPQGQGDAPAADSDPDAFSGQTSELLLGELEERSAVDAGLYRPVALGGQLWNDANANGLREPVENGLPGLAVTLLHGGEPVSTTQTGANGLYTFGSLAPDSYAVEIPLGDGRAQFSPRPPAGESPGESPEDEISSTVDPATGRTDAVTIVSGSSLDSLHAGVYRRAVVAGRVWEDADLNGVQNSGEAGVPGVAVRLFDAEGALLGAATTDAQGRYIFTSVDGGRYMVQFEPPGAYRFASFQGRSSDPALDSDVGADGRSPTLTLETDTEVRTMDAAVARLGNTTTAILNLAADPLQNGVALIWLPNHTLQGDDSLSRFRIWRSQSGNRGDATLITPQPLRITAAPHEQHYLDTTVVVGQRYTYWIESEDVRGTVSEFGPVSATPDAAAQRVVSDLYLPIGVRQLPVDD